MPFLTQGKTNWKFLLIIIILAIIVGGGTLWYAKRPEKPYQPVEIKESKTANWKTYRNEKFGYEIKYPQNIYLDKYPENLCIKEEYESVEFMDCEALEKPKLYAPRVIIDISVHATELSLHEWLKEVGTEENLREESYLSLSEKCPALCLFSSVSEIKDIYVNNIPALQFNSWLVSTDGVVVLIRKPPKTIIDITNFHTGIGVKGFSDKIFSQMLSTFKFLE